MEDQILDYFGEFDTEGRVIRIRSFAFESAAHLYALRLKEGNIPFFLSNTITSSALPIELGGIGLHVHEKNAEAALQIMAAIDTKQQVPLQHEDYRDVDREEIDYLAAVNSSEKSRTPLLFLGLLLLIALLIVRSFLHFNWF